MNRCYRFPYSFIRVVDFNNKNIRLLYLNRICLPLWSTSDNPQLFGVVFFLGGGSSLVSYVVFCILLLVYGNFSFCSMVLSFFDLCVRLSLWNISGLFYTQNKMLMSICFRKYLNLTILDQEFMKTLYTRPVCN